MFLWHLNLVKIKANTLGFSYSVLVKLQSQCIRKNIFFNRIQNLSLGSCCYKDIKKVMASDVPCTGLEQIASLSRISKKNNQLSKLEDLEEMEKLKSGYHLYPYKDYNERAKVLTKENVKVTYRNLVHDLSNVKIGDLKGNYFDNATDILVIGGGAVGLTIAYSIRNEFPYGPQVTVVDKDKCVPHLSTNLGQGLISLQQFSEDEEISILKYGAEFFSAFTRHTEIRDIKFNINYDPLGSLVLVDDSNVDKVMKNYEKLKMFQINNKLLDKKTLERRFPWLNFDNIHFGSLGMFGEGVIDPWAYIVAMKYKCESLGVNFVTAEVFDFGFENNSLKRALCKLPDGSYNYINFCFCILAGGLESLNLVHLLNESNYYPLTLKLPMEERMKYEYFMYNPDGPGLNTPIVFNSDGTYFRREGLTGHYVAGVPSVVWNEDGDDENNPYHVFDRVVKSFLVERLPSLKKIDVVGGWIDAYDFCISNKVGITGPHPCDYRLFFALGFSHLGMQFLPALGRGIMELICYDNYRTINFEPFHIENLWKKQHLEADKKRRELLEAEQKVALSE